MSNAPIADNLLESMLGDFLDESAQLLERLNANLLLVEVGVNALDKGQTAPCDEQLMNEMFRAAHSLKGLSAMLGLANINLLTHKVENVFDAARRDELRFDKHSMEVLFLSVDRLAGLIAHLKDPAEDEPAVGKLIEEIDQLLTAAGRVDTPADQGSVDEHFSTTFVETLAPLSSESDAPEQFERTDVFQQIFDEADIPSKYLSIFIDEMEISLDSLTEVLLSESGRIDRAGVESLMIVSHRIKGSAASVGLNRTAKLSHCMEDLLQERLETGVALNQETVDVLLRCVDALRRYTDGLKTGTPDTSRFAEAYFGLLDLQLHSAAPAKIEATRPAEPASPQRDRLTQEELREIRQAGSAHGTGIIGRVRFQQGFPLIGLKAQLVHERLAQLGEVFFCSPSAETLDQLDQLDSLRFGVATSLESSEVANRVRVVGVADVELTLLAPAVAAAPSPAVSEAAPKEQAAEAKSTENRPAETLRVDIERLDQLMSLAGQLVINKARFFRIGEELKQVTGNKRVGNRLADVFQNLGRLDEALDASEDQSTKASLATFRNHVRFIRRDLDTLRVELERMTSAKSSVGDLVDAVHQLDRVTDGIQRTVMDTRMVPIGPLFGRFRRVVRDITRMNNKDIRLEIHGEKTELDKRMIDELGDPLIHMVRNSADHGIESPEARVAAGKPAQGVVTLNAFHRGNRIVIQVSDDGKGLDQERIRKKALERELAPAADLERMTVHQIYNLIWEPGFSTAEKVTEISGRGMGMDIVKSKIEELNGTVEVDSVPGQGATFTIKLPLTMAILPSLMAEVGGVVYSLPIESVVEIVRIPAADVKTVHAVPTACVRGRTVSIVALNELFTWNGAPAPGSPSNTTDLTMVILGSEGQELGLRVDGLLGEENIVIKSLADNYRNVPGLAGASILGDGRVALILDTGELIGAASRRGILARVTKETVA